MAHFEALQLALELATELRRIIEMIAQHGRDLVSQLRRAATSVAEIKTQLKLAMAWGYVGQEQTEVALKLADRMVAITWRLTRPRT